MLTTAQENAVREWVVAAIADCTELAPIALDRVVWSEQDFAEHPYPYALLAYTGSDTLNATPSQSVNEADDLVTGNLEDTNLAVTIVSKVSDTAPSRNQVASSYVRELAARTRSFVAEHHLGPAKLAVRELTQIPNVGRLQGLSQWESRSVLDLLLGHSLEVTESPGVIE